MALVLALVLVIGDVEASATFVVEPPSGSGTSVDAVDSRRETVRPVVELAETSLFLLVVGVVRETLEAAPAVAVTVVGEQVRDEQKQSALVLRLQSTHMRVSSVTNCSVQ